MYQQGIMYNLTGQSIGMGEVRMERLYLQELTFIQYKLVIILTPERW